MRRRTGFGKLGVLALVLVLALVGGGVAYATWSQELVITETVQTGELCWGFQEGSFGSLKDGATPPPPYTVAQGANIADIDWTIGTGFVAPLEQMGKNVGWTTGELTGEKGEHLGFKLYSTANITLHNVYPSYYNELSLIAANGGSIPLIFNQLIINGVVCDQGVTYVLDLDGDTQVMEIKWVNHLGYQLDPCDEIELSFKVHILEDDDYPPYDQGGAEQDETYQLIITLVGTQWNMVP